MDETKAPGTRPYEVIAYAALGVVTVMQIMEGNALGGLLTLGCGAVAMLAKMQLGPIFYVVLLSGSLLAHYNQGVSARNPFRPAFLNFGDVVTCLGVLAFVAAHYRLQGIWYHHLARDPRRRSSSFSTRPEADSQSVRRGAGSVAQAEVSWLIISLPLWALAAQFLTQAIPLLRPSGVDPWLQPWLLRMLLAVWALGLAVFVAANLLEVWQRYQMGGAAAWIYLQDTLWRETRGEQRKLQRWLAWQRMRRRHR